MNVFCDFAQRRSWMQWEEGSIMDGHFAGSSLALFPEEIWKHHCHPPACANGLLLKSPLQYSPHGSFLQTLQAFPEEGSLQILIYDALQHRASVDFPVLFLTVLYLYQGEGPTSLVLSSLWTMVPFYCWLSTPSPDYFQYIRNTASKSETILSLVKLGTVLVSDDTFIDFTIYFITKHCRLHTLSSTLWNKAFEGRNRYAHLKWTLIWGGELEICSGYFLLLAARRRVVSCTGLQLNNEPCCIRHCDSKEHGASNIMHYIALCQSWVCWTQIQSMLQCCGLHEIPLLYSTASPLVPCCQVSHLPIQPS